MLFVKSYFKNLRKISKITSYSRNGEEEVTIEFKTATVEIFWDSHQMDAVFTIGDKRENYKSADIPDRLKGSVKSTINGYFDIKAKLVQLDELLYSYFAHVK